MSDEKNAPSQSTTNSTSRCFVDAVRRPTCWPHSACCLGVALGYLFRGSASTGTAQAAPSTTARAGKQRPAKAAGPQCPSRAGAGRGAVARGREQRSQRLRLAGETGQPLLRRAAVPQRDPVLRAGAGSFILIIRTSAPTWARRIGTPAILKKPWPRWRLP